MIERLRVRIPAGAAGEFSSLELTLCADSYFAVRSISVLPQWHVKDPGHSAKSIGGRIQLNTQTPLTQCGRSGLTMPMSRNSVGTSYAIFLFLPSGVATIIILIIPLPLCVMRVFPCHRPLGFSHGKVDVGSLTCATIAVRAVHTETR